MASSPAVRRLLDLGAVGACLAEQSEDLVVVLADGSLAEASAADGVGGVDAGVDGEARGGDVAPSLEIAGSGLGELLGLGGVRADLRGRRGPGAAGLSQRAPPGAHRR